MSATVPPSLHDANPPLLGRVRAVLIGTSHPGNVGAAARALKTMGWSELWLVAPLRADVCQHPEARALASGATDVLDRARVVSHLDDALADVCLAVAVSAEPREFGPAPEPPEAAARHACTVLQAHADHRVAWVFGPERTGLSIQAVQACQRMVSISANPLYASLNLAQAIMIVAYQMRQAALGVRHTFAAARPGERLADHGAVRGLLQHGERVLALIGFLDPAHPKKLLPRLRRWLLRSRLRSEEVDLLRGICKQMEQRARLDRGGFGRGD